MSKVKILPIPAIKMALEQRESFWHANGHRKREKHAKIDLKLAGYVYIWCATLNHNPVCQKNHCFFWFYEKIALDSATEKKVNMKLLDFKNSYSSQ